MAGRPRNEAGRRASAGKTPSARRAAPSARNRADVGTARTSRQSAPPRTRSSAARPTTPNPVARRRTDLPTRNAAHTRNRNRPDAGRSYNTPAVWTKGAPSTAQQKNPLVRVLGFLGRMLAAVLSLLGKGLLVLARAFVALVSRSRIALAACLIALAMLVGGLVDFSLNAGKAYPGVHIGELDVAGKTEDEITQLVESEYGPRLASGSAVIYASDDAAARVSDQASSAQDTALAEQLAVEEARASKLAWTADASALAASIPARDLARQALSLGRESGGLPARLGAMFAGSTIDVRAEYGSKELEELAANIDLTIGNPRVDYGISLDNGTAVVTEGHDGAMMDRDAFERSLDQALLAQGDTSNSFVARADYAPLRIGREAAQATADGVNRAISDGVQFAYEDATWTASASDVGAWISARVDEKDGGYALTAYIDEARAKPSLLSHVDESNASEPVHVTFEANGEEATVRTDGSGTIPLVVDAVAELDAVLFGSEGKASGSPNAAPAGTPANVSIASGSAPTTLSFDEALELGIIGSIASYTTEFSTGSGTENRNHNIALVSELLSNSIVKPGQSWSFNETAGECNEANGFLGAGAIVDGEYDDAVGGGICQVATTMFNAVFDSGFPVITRHNHSLYISSYPLGRDAAVSWPDLDLVWENDGKSDVLVRLSCADGSVTATLYGVDPGYRVSSVASELSEGEHYATKTKVDELLAPGTSYVKTRGTNGSTISVTRTVADASGSVLHEEAFSSVYDPVTEVVVKGPDSENDSTSDKTAGNASA